MATLGNADIIQPEHSSQAMPSNSSVGQRSSLAHLLRGPPSSAARPRRLSDNDARRSELGPNSKKLPGFPSRSEDWAELKQTLLEPGTKMSVRRAPKPLKPHQCTKTTCSVLKAFALPEILEQILCLLDTNDIFTLRRVARHWKDTIHASWHLRLHLFMNTHAQVRRPIADCQLLPVGMPGLRIEKDGPLYRGQQWINVYMTPNAARTLCPDFGSQRPRSRSIYEGLKGGLGKSANDAWPSVPDVAYETNRLVPLYSLLVSQPPPVQMQAYLVYAEGEAPDADAESSARAKLQRPKGISLGVLASTALTLFTGDTGCEECDMGSESSSSASSLGPQPIRVVFKGVIAPPGS